MDETVLKEIYNEFKNSGPKLSWDEFAKGVHDLRQKLIEKAKSRETEYYGDIMNGRAIIGKLLGAISEYELRRGRPPLSAIVIRKDTKMPGKGFFTIPSLQDEIRALSTEEGNVFWEDKKNEVFECWSKDL